MSIKKIKLACSFIIFFLCAGILTACGGGKINVEFNKSSLTMNINQEIDLNELVNITGGNIEDVQFKSSDSSVVYITPSNKIVSRSEGVSIVSAEGYVDAYIEITVEKTTIKFDAPSNVSYDESKNAIVWDAVYAGNTVATSYEVSISKNGGEKVVEVVNKNAYEVFGAGNYSVSVSCLSRNGIQKSDATAEYNFSILSAPTNLLYNDQTGKLTWSAEESATAFRVYVNGVSSEILTSKEYKLNLAEPKRYDISVMTCAGENQTNVFGATSKENITLTRLAAPELEIESGVITWEDMSLGAQKFDVQIVGTETTTETIAKNGAGKYSFALTGKGAGFYDVSIRAIGNFEENGYSSGEHYLNSDISTIKNIEKLHTQQLSFDKNSNTVRVVDFEQGKKYLLTIIAGTESRTEDISSTGVWTENFDVAGEYKFSLVNASNNNDLQINSDESNVLTVVKLDEVSLVNHEVKNAKYFVKDYNVSNATNYDVRVYLNDDDVGVSLTDENNDISSLFGASGEYRVSIISKGTDNVEKKIYYLDSITNTNLSVIRLKDVEATDDVDYKRISWEKVSTLGNIRYNYQIVGKEDIYTLEVNELDYSGFGVGSYTAKIWATVSEQIGTQNIVLDSKNKEEVSFVVDEMLAKPVVSWSVGSGENSGKYYLNITAVNNATHYEISCNNSLPIKVEKANADSTIVEITDLVIDAGEYNFVVKAISEGEELSGYYKESPESEELTAVRLTAPELELDDANKQIKWEAVYSGAEVDYYYQIDQSTDIYDKKELFIDYSSLTAGEYTITVWADIKTSQAGRKTILLPSDSNSETIEIYEDLEAPTIQWNNDESAPKILISTVSNAGKYNVYLNNSETPFEQITQLKECDVSGYVENAGVYTFKVEAVGINKYYRTSERASLIAVRLETLKNVKDDKNNNQVIWDAVTGYSNLVYYYQIDGEEIKETTKTSVKYLDMGIGEHNIELWVGSKNNASETIILDSQKENITFEVYKQLNNPELSFETENDKVYLKIKEVANADGHLIYLNDSNVALSDEEITTSSKDGFIYIDVTKFVESYGEYKFRVVSTSSNKYYENSGEKLVTIVRLANCVLNNNSIESKIQWDVVTTKYNVDYEYELLGPQDIDGGYSKRSQGTLQVNVFNYLELDAGKYSISIYAKARENNKNDLLILESAEKTTKEFDVRKTILSPSVELVKGGDANNTTYTLHISNPNGIHSFAVKYNENDAVTVPAVGVVGAKTTYDITDIINNNPETQRFMFSITPKGAVNGYYDDGAATSYEVSRIANPNKFKVNVNADTGYEVFESKINQSYYKSTEVLIKSDLDSDFVETSALNADANNFIVRVRYLAQNGANVNTIYYLDSGYSEFKFSRIATRFNVNGGEISWTSDETTQSFNSKLFVNIENKITQVPTAIIQNNSVNITAVMAGYDAFNDIKVMLSMIARSFEGELQEEAYYLSSKQISFDLIKANKQNINLSVVEENGLVKIDWNKKAEATYKLNGSNITEFASTRFIGNESNIFSIEERIETKLSVYIFIVSRIKDIEKISIDEAENIEVVDQLPLGAQEVVSEINGNAVQNLTQITSNEVSALNVYYKASQSQAYKYYLDSNKVIFTFRRLQNLSGTNFVVKNNILNWVLEEDKSSILNVNNYKYNLIFTNAENETVEELIDVEAANSIEFSNEKYAAIIYSGYTKVRVQKVISEFIATPNTTGCYYLSDKQTNNLSLKILNAPDAVNIEAVNDGYKQEQIKINWSWTEENKNPVDYNISEYVVQILKEQSVVKEFVTTQSYIEILDGSYFDGAGNWGVKIKLVGTEDTISSNISRQYSIQRLADTKRGLMSNDGIISWQEVEGAVGYLLEIKYSKINGEYVNKIVSNISELTANGAALVEFQKDGGYYSYSGLKEISSEDFEGTIIVKVFAVGSGNASNSPATLTSEREFEFERLKKVNVSLTNKALTILNYNVYSNTETITIIPSINGENLDNYKIAGTVAGGNTYTWNYPKFTKNGQPVEFDVAKEIKFTIYATTTSDNSMQSNITEVSAVKLGNVSNLRFIREGKDIFFKVDNLNSYGRTNVNLYGSDIKNNIDESRNMSIKIDEDILMMLFGSWTFTSYAEGEIYEDVIYIDGESSEISGKILEKIQNIFVDNTHRNVMWSVNQYIEEIDAQCGPTAYELVVYNVSDRDGTIKYLLKTLDEAYELMDSYSAGEYYFSIKTLGNVTTNAISENIVLDSIYSEEELITKLSNELNVNVNKGFFSLSEIANKELIEYDLVAVIFDEINGSARGEYILEKVGDRYENAAIIDYLLDYKEHYIRFYAKTTEEYYISSSYAQINSSKNYLKIKLFDESDNLISLENPYIYYNNENDYQYNYAITNAVFKTNPAVNSGIMLSINSSIQNLEHSNKIIKQLDETGSWTAGTHTIKYAQYGTTGVDSEITYLTKFGKEITVTKLQAPKLEIKQHDTFIRIIEEGRDPQELKENYLTFNRVQDANIYYLYDERGNIIRSYNKEVEKIDLNGIPSGTYAKLAMKSVSKQAGVLASNLAFLQDDENNDLIINKFATREMTFMEGAFGTEILGSIFSMSGDYKELQESSMATDLLDPTLIINRFVDIQFIDPSTNVIVKQHYMRLVRLFITNFTYGGFEAKGFPTLNYGFLDDLKDLPGGEYKVKFRVIGSHNIENEYMFSSDYSLEKTIYVSPAPQITINNETKVENKYSDDEYVLSFNNVLVNEGYITRAQDLQYQLVGIKEDDTREVISSKSPNAINNNETIKFNLSELIRSGLLTTEYKKLMVYVKGGTSRDVLINGKFSNIIEVKALQNIDAFVEHGTIKWYAQDGATRYIIKYTSNSGDTEKIIPFAPDVTTYEWDAKELTEGVEYKVSIMAYGTLNNSSDVVSELVLSGPLTDIGKVYKLPTISNDKNSMIIENGMFKWSKVANANSYDVFINTEEITDGNFGDYNTVINYNKIDDEFVRYETTVFDTNTYYYNFRAVGSDIEKLDEASIIYVNSNISAVQVAKRNASVYDIALINGYLTWKSEKNDVSFRLTFIKGDSDVVINLSTGSAGFEKDSETGYYKLDLNAYNELKQSGSYTVKIQEYYKDKKAFDVTSTGYLLVSSAVTKELYKLEVVENVTIKKGVISWEYNGKQVNDYFFRLVFTYKSTDEDKTIEAVVDVPKDAGNKYSNAVFEYDGSGIDRKEITMMIYVVPGAANDKDVTSTSYNFKEATDNYVTQVHEISEIEGDILISITDQNMLKIEWRSVADCEYEIEYWTDINAERNYISGIENNYYIWGADPNSPSFDFDGEYTLFVRIRAIPLTDNYLRSVWTSQKGIKKPSKVEGLTYNADTRNYTWNEYNTGDSNSFKYSIKYEVGDIVDGEFVASKAYIFETATSTDTTFTPFKLGIHRVSVAVKVNSGSSELMSDYMVADYGQSDFADTTGLFNGGDGMTKETAYQINTEEQFSNMKYRLSKDNQKTIKRVYVLDEFGFETDIEQENYDYNVENEFYYFIQTNHLYITRDYALIDYENAGMEFNGNYNGDYYSLTFVWNEDITNQINSNIEAISIFDTIGYNGSLENIRLNIVLGKETETGIESLIIEREISIAGLALTNNGTISNILIGNMQKVETVTITEIISTVQFAYLVHTNTNYGNIQGVENYYNTEITSKNNNLNAYVLFGAIAVNNQGGKISQVKNAGNIKFSAYTLTVGGLVAGMDTNSELKEATNIGNIDIFIGGIYQVSNIGGLVGQASVSNINNSYVVSNMNISCSNTHSSDDESFCVGGLVGYMSGGSISYSFANINVNENVGSSQTKITVMQLIGYLTSITNQNNNASVYVYYKQPVEQNDKPINGDGILTNIVVYDSVITEANANELVSQGEFSADKNYNGNLVLSWEITFEKQVWKELPVEA